MNKIAIITAALALSLAPASARADLVFTFTSAPDGGVNMFATGTSTGESGDGDNRVKLPFNVDNLFGPHNHSFNSDSISGTITMDGVMFDVFEVQLQTFGTNDEIDFIPIGFPNMATVTANDLTATWVVSNVAFSTLTPGTYSGLVAGTSVVVVADPIPAPGAALLAIIGLGMVNRLKRRFA